MLKTIRTTNYKSLGSEPISLNKLNVLIGANASGKSGFVDALKFIHDIVNSRLSYAVGKRLGWENVRKRGVGEKTKIGIEIDCELGMEDIRRIPRKADSTLVRAKYAFEASYRTKKYFLDTESFESQFIKKGATLTEEFKRINRKVEIKPLKNSRGKHTHFTVPRTAEDAPFIQAGFYLETSYLLYSNISGWRFYELDVSNIRRPFFDEGQSYLRDDGRNLAAILEKLRTRPMKGIRLRILNLMSLLIPGFEDWRTEQQFDGSLGFKIHEKGINKGFPPKVISDGTIRLLAILVALLYKPSATKLICIDEPERYLHPQIMETLVEIMRDISNETQLIVTTHSTELVKWLKPSEVLLVGKIDNTTNIVRVNDVELIDKFLEKFTLDELWRSGYLKGGNIM